MEQQLETYDDIEVENGNPDDDPRLQSIVKSLEANSKPKAHKIKDFKSRVLGLLQIYALNTNSHESLFRSYEGVYKQVTT
jgi:hypothetical protein